MHRVTVVVRVVAPAPFEAAPDASACAVELTTHQPRSLSLPRDNIDQCCEVRLAANSTSIRLSPDSAAWFRGAEGRQVLACLPCITDDEAHQHAGATADTRDLCDTSDASPCRADTSDTARCRSGSMRATRPTHGNI